MPTVRTLNGTAKAMSIATLVALAAILIAYGALWLDLGTARAALGEMLPGIAAQGVTVTQLRLGAALGVAPLAILAIALWHLYNFFCLYRRGEPFPAGSGERLKQFGRWLIALAIATLVVRCVSSVLFSWQLGEGKRQLAISISSSDLILLLFGALMLMIGGILAEARRVAEENRMFV